MGSVYSLGMGTEFNRISGSPILVPRVLEVVKSRLCYIVGTVYMDMPLKPNVMEDIARDVSSFSFRHRFFHIAVV